MKKIFKRILIIFAIALVTIFIVAIEFFMPTIAVTPYRRDVSITPNSFGLRYENFTVKRDDINIEGYWIPNDTAKASVICLHGYHSCKERYLDFAKSLHEAGYNVALIDLRAHGKSGGKYCTFGFQEKYDVQKVLDFVIEKGKTDDVGIHGSSLGGAVAIQSIALDNRFKFGIIESTFTNYRDVTYEYSDDYVGFKNHILTNRVIGKASKKAGFSPDDVNPEECCKKITIPMFMEHGTSDERIPYEFGQRNFKALASENKVFYTIQNGKHQRIFQQGGEPYWNAMKTFLDHR